MAIHFLQGERIYLRPLELSDANEKYQQWLNDQAVTKWMRNGIFPVSSEALRSFIAEKSGTDTQQVFAIIHNASKEHIGNIGIHGISSIFRSGDVGILIGDKGFWGQGYATEAIELLSKHCFERMNLHRLSAGAVEENVGCINAFEKAGFLREGLARDAYYCAGAYRNCVMLGRINQG